MLSERNNMPGIKQNSLRTIDVTIIQKTCNDFLVQAKQNMYTPLKVKINQTLASILT